MYLLLARIADPATDKSVVCCFDPKVVAVRLRTSIPESNIDPHDYSWKDYDYFVSINDTSGAREVAERDAQRRGPILKFTIPIPDGSTLSGHIERYLVEVMSDMPFPNAIRERFMGFLESLRFASCVKVKSVRLEGNDETPA